MSNAPYLSDKEFEKYLDDTKYKQKVTLSTSLRSMKACEGTTINIAEVGYSKIYSASAGIRQYLKQKFPKETFHIKVIDNENIRIWRLI